MIPVILVGNPGVVADYNFQFVKFLPGIEDVEFERLVPGVFLIIAGGLLITWRERRRRVDLPAGPAR